ncbi:hypothetical protein LJR251_005921 [Rhizobium rhizogenes]|uniref:hypothetical protein n=1 Tax=Rhizobium rhizogenes TaxID=359 RepID=UPI003ED0B65C
MYRAKSIRGVVLAASFLTTSALADEEGYIGNWVGTVKLELQIPSDNSPQLEVVPLPDNLAPEPLSQRLGSAWSTTRPKLCEEIQAALQQMGAVSKWLSCDLAEAGELRGRASNPSLYPNRLELKYVIAGNRIRFEAPTPTPFGNWFDPIIQADFNVVMRLTLVFGTTLDGSDLPTGFDTIPVPPNPPDPPNAPYLQKPLLLTSALISFEKAKIQYGQHLRRGRQNARSRGRVQLDDTHALTQHCGFPRDEPSVPQGSQRPIRFAADPELGVASHQSIT